MKRIAARLVDELVDVRKRLNRLQLDSVEPPVLMAEASLLVRLSCEHDLGGVQGARLHRPAPVEQGGFCVRLSSSSSCDQGFISSETIEFFSPAFYHFSLVMTTFLLHAAPTQPPRRLHAAPTQLHSAPARSPRRVDAAPGGVVEAAWPLSAVDLWRRGGGVKAGWAAWRNRWGGVGAAPELQKDALILFFYLSMLAFVLVDERLIWYSWMCLGMALLQYLFVPCRES